VATLAKLIVSIGANSAEFTTEINKVQSELKNFQKSTKDLDAVMNPIGTALRAVGVAAVAAFSAGGAAALASGQIIEKYRMSLTTLMGSSKAAGEAVASALNLASKTPFTDDELLAATVALTKFGQDAKTVLPQVANMAAATNGDVASAAEAYGRFLLGQTKALSAYGINKAMVLAEGAKTEAGIEIANQKGTIVNQAAFNTALLSLMDKRFKAGAVLQANSLGGLIKGMKDTGEDILRTIAGFSDDGTVRVGSMFDFFKQGITAVLAKVEEWKANGSLQKWADDVGAAITTFFTNAKIVFGWMVDIATFIAKNWDLITPVLGGVLGAFLAFKVVTGVVDGIAIAVAALKDVLIVTNGVLALTPIGAIMLAVAALTVVVIAAANAWRDYNAAMNPKLTTNASTDNIQALRTKLDQFDKDTAKNLQVGKESAEWTQDQITSYEAARAKDRLVIQQQLQSNIDGVRGAAMNKQATAQTDAIAKQKKEAAAAAAAIAAAEQQARDARAPEEKAAADKALKAAQAHAAEVLKINSDLDDKTYKLSHTVVEGQIYDLAKARDAAIADGGSKLKADEAYTLAAKKVYDDARTSKAAADKDAADKTLQAQKDAQDKYIASLADYVSKQKNIFSALTSIIIDNYNLEKTKAVNDLNTERDTGINDLNDMITKRQDKLTSDLDTIGKMKTEAVNALNAERDATVNALNDMITARQTELTSTLDAIDTEKAATVNALDDIINKRQDELNLTLDAISKEKAAALGQWDAQIQALQDTQTAAQNTDTLSGLRDTFSNAKDAPSILAAQKAIDKELAKEAYDTQLASLQKQKQAASDTYDAETAKAQKSGDAQIQSLKDQVTAAQTSYAAMTTAAQKSGNVQIQSLKDTLTAAQSSYATQLTATNAYYDQVLAAATKSGNAEIQQLKDALIAFQKSEDDRLISINTFYDQKLATANVNATAEALLATNTNDQILKMLTDSLPEYATLGAQLGNALYGDALALQAQLLALQQATVQVQSNGKAPAGLSVGTTVATAGGDYKITAVKPDGSYTSVSVAPVIPPLFGGGSSRMLMAHANGGYFTTPHIGLIAENGPEAVVPQSQFAAFANQVGGGDTAAGLRQLGLKLDMLTSAVRQVAPGVGSVINGLGRA